MAAGYKTDLKGSTVHKEQQRVNNIGTISQSVGAKHIMGIVVEVHPSKAMVKAMQPGTNRRISSGKWIPLSHSPEDIIERFGTIRIGMGCYVVYDAPGEFGAIGTLIHNEGDKFSQEEVLENKVSTATYAIFTPGV